MKPFFRLVGWFMLIVGLGLAVLARSARNGVAPLGIDLFGGSINSPESGARWIGASIGVAVFGVVLLFLTRRNWRNS